jgi:hypothetical protein
MAIQTAKTMTPDSVPEGARPDEFLRDEDLPAFYERAGDMKAARAARRAAAMTAEALAAATDELVADEDADSKKGKGR